MRRRDFIFLCVAWGLFLAGLMWALSTQFRWVRENKPIQVKSPAGEPPEPAPVQTPGTGVIGTVTEDTVVALGRGLAPPKPPAPRPVPGKPPTRPDRANPQP